MWCSTVGFIVTLILSLLAAPLAAHAQQTDRVRRIGVLQGLAANDPEYVRRIGAFRRGLQELGWLEGRNIALHIYSPEGRFERLPAFAAELVQANVDVIVTAGTAAVQPRGRRPAPFPSSWRRSVMP